MKRNKTNDDIRKAKAEYLKKQTNKQKTET